MRIEARRSLLLLIGVAVVLAAVVLSTQSVPRSRAIQPRIEPPVFAQQNSREMSMGAALFRDIARRQNPVVVAVVTQAHVQRADSRLTRVMPTWIAESVRSGVSRRRKKCQMRTSQGTACARMSAFDAETKATSSAASAALSATQATTTSTAAISRRS
jgi:hypothetical protein